MAWNGLQMVGSWLAVGTITSSVFGTQQLETVTPDLLLTWPWPSTRQLYEHLPGVPGSREYSPVEEELVIDVSSMFVLTTYLLYRFKYTSYIFPSIHPFHGRRKIYLNWRKVNNLSYDFVSYFLTSKLNLVSNILEVLKSYCIFFIL